MNKQNEDKNEDLETIKRYVRASGFPFENEIEQILFKAASKFSVKEIGELRRGHQFIRNSSFVTKNEDGGDVIRSLDFDLFFFTDTKVLPGTLMPKERSEGVYLKFLIDAKYTESEAWLFTPAEDEEASLSSVCHFLPMERVGKDELCRKDIDELTRLHRKWPMAVSGKKVAKRKSGNEQLSDRDSLTSHQAQIIKGVHSQLEEDIFSAEYGLSEGGSPGHSAVIAVPIIVTNAPVYLVNKTLNLAQVAAANEPDELWTKQGVLGVTSPDLFQIREKAFQLRDRIGKLEFGALEFNGGYSGTTLFVQQDSLEQVITEYLTAFRALKEGDRVDPMVNFLKGPRL